MPWSVEWSLVLIAGLLTVHCFWLSRTERRLWRSVCALEDMTKQSQGGADAPVTD